MKASRLNVPILYTEMAQKYLKHHNASSHLVDTFYFFDIIVTLHVAIAFAMLSELMLITT